MDKSKIVYIVEEVPSKLPSILHALAHERESEGDKDRDRETETEKKKKKNIKTRMNRS